jgi:lipoprotein-anchoring transpeptidase ErfK/SrfK
LFVLLLLAGVQTASAQTTAPAFETFQNNITCMPTSLRARSPVGDCLRTSPVDYRARLQAAGVDLPERPFRYVTLDPAYFTLDYQYMRVRDDIRKNQIPVFGSMQDVNSKSAAISQLDPSFTYITYLGVVDGKYVQTTAGTWLARGDVTPVAVPQVYRGLLFPYTPSTDFGWVLLEMPVRSAPGYTGPEIPGETVAVNQVIQIYETTEVDGTQWNRIGENRWVEGRLVNQVMVNTTPPEGVDNGRWIEVNLAEQTVSVYDHDNLIYATVAATGVEPLYTRPGLFQIYEKHATTPMTTSDPDDYYYLENVPWTMYFDKARALHGAYWRAKLGIAQSHGCVNLSVGDARWLYEWAHVGDWVYAWDPTGQTPTDPNYYGDGGA